MIRIFMAIAAWVLLADVFGGDSENLTSAQWAEVGIAAICILSVTAITIWQKDDD
jgi:uncharacterized membrane protein YuzA (DUF378 family)